MLNEQQAASIRAREQELRVWLGSRTSYHPGELPAEMNPPTNDERSALEVFEFCCDKPEKYFLYISEKHDSALSGPTKPRIATTWMGEKLGDVQFGREWRDSFGGTRVSITIRAINGCAYYGTYYKSSGSYARVKRQKA